MWMLGSTFNEIKYREKISNERYEVEWEQTHERVMARLEEKLAAAQTSRGVL
jgi:hypothetical protein